MGGSLWLEWYETACGFDEARRLTVVIGARGGRGCWLWAAGGGRNCAADNEREERHSRRCPFEHYPCSSREGEYSLRPVTQGTSAYLRNIAVQCDPRYSG